jgi:uncharacterized protein YndB with AHSA1/START domain
MSGKPTTTVQIKHHYNASSERVFDAWLDPEKAGKFLFATPTGQMVRVEIDARPGGSFVFTDRRDGEDIDHTGTYEIIERPTKIVFSFNVPKYTKELTRVIVEITPQDQDGGCELTLTHEKVWQDFSEQTQKGWNMILTSLEEALE